MHVWQFCSLFILTFCIGCGSNPSKDDKKAGSSPTGKSDKGSANAKDDLMGLGVAYHAYHDMKKEGPSTVDDLINMISDAAKKESFTKSEACQKLKSGEFVINPRLQFSMIKEMSKVAILHEKKAVTEGGWVILADGSPVEMKAAEFKALDKGDEARAPAKK